MFVRFLFGFYLGPIYLGPPCGHLLGKSCPLGFSLVFFFFFSAVLIVGVTFPFGVKGRKWNSILSTPNHCLLSTSSTTILLFSYCIRSKVGNELSFFLSTD